MRVLVTRPEPDASRTADRLRRLGHDPVIVPLQAIRSLAPDLPAGRFEAVAATSANALRNAPPDVLRALIGLPCFVVGGETAKAATDAGFANVRRGPGDASGLAATMVGALPSGARVAYLSGRKRKDAFETGLRAAGIAVTALETYDAADCTPSATELAAASACDAVLVYSAGAARRLAAIFPDRLDGVSPVCISIDAANALPEAWRGRAVVAATPDEPALLVALGRL